ncbi:MAG: DUF2905 domain-containing protein [Ignavibacteria bacterium]|nr:DUF2905 domain-containing protein [Ignavibacteria bacterium]
MEGLQSIGRILLVSGIVMAMAGLLLMYGGKIPFFGKLPGDIVIRRENFTFYFPLATSILISIIISLVFYFLSRRR